MKKYLVTLLLSIGFVFQVTAQDTITVVFGSNELKDAYINNVNTNPNDTCQSIIASVWTYYGEHGIGRGLFGFDFSDISDQDVAIIDARLNLYHDPIGSHIGHSTLGGENSGVICRITEKWFEDSVTWANQPKTTNTNSVYIQAPENDTMDFLNVDITPVIKDIFRNPHTSDGFMIKLNSEVDLYRSLLFASSDNHMPKYHPSLSITFLTEPPVDSVEQLPVTENTSIYSLSDKFSTDLDQSLISMVAMPDGEWEIARAFFNFDLDAIYPEHTITRAEINLYHDSDSEISGHINSGASNRVLLRRVIGDWNESDISWTNQPEVSDLNMILLPSSNVENQDYLNIDVTQMVLDMIHENDKAFGFCMSMADETTLEYERNVVFASSYHPNSGLHPELVVYTQDYSGVEHITVIKNVILVYPNPGNGLFTIEIDSELKSATFKVFDMGSNIVSAGALNGRTMVLNLLDQPTGIYFLIIDGDGFKGTTRIIKR